MKLTIILVGLLFAANAVANQSKGWLVKFNNRAAINNFQSDMSRSGLKVKDFKLANWVKVDLSDDQVKMLKQHPDVVAIEKNITLKIQTNFEVFDPIKRKQIEEMVWREKQMGVIATRGTDNPDFPTTGSGGSGADPLFDQQWGMLDNNVKSAWSNSGTKGDQDVVVAVLDTGVDYTHEDLVDNMWRNPGETGLDANGNDKTTNGIDDDGNGFIDDVVGWDFGRGDNKPYDLHKTGLSLLTGGNPGHGTHVAGCVAARADNGKGIAGVAPNVKIMAMRFLTEDGQGSLEGAIDAIKYASDMGAQILNNSWGSEGDGGDAATSKALTDAIQYSQDAGALFVAAAGNGRQGVGYDNDSDSKPAFPASYSNENILSVAALDETDALGAFSNWGRTTVDIGAPGVKVYSTVPDNVYQDTVINIPGFIVATWDGTSMASPHVAGAAALYLSKHPNADWRELKQQIMNSAAPISSLNGKAVSGGKLDVKALMQ